MVDITDWLTQHQLGHLDALFEQHAIGIDVLDQLTAADMAELGIALGDRYRLQSAITERAPKPLPSQDTKAHFRHVTVLYSDLVGSTRLSVELNVEVYRNALRRYQETVATVMTQYGGTITRYDGDGILVLFGFPHAHEDDPDRAVQAALDSIEAVAALPPADNNMLASRIGIATGEVVVGDQIGKGSARQFATAGITPNLAEHLEGLAEPNTVVISESTLRLVKTALDTVSLPPTDVTGLTDPVNAYIVTGEQASPGIPTGDSRGVTPLIARKAECDQLQRTWQAVQEGEGMVTIILGEAGIGKSRLVEEFLKNVPDERVLQLFCLPRYQNSTLHPIVQRLQDSVCLEQNPMTGQSGKRIVRLPGLDENTDERIVNVFETLLSLPSGDADQQPAHVEREQLFNAITYQLTAMLGTGVAIVVVEDLHWADPTSLELLERVATMVSTHPFLLLATARPDVIPAFTTSRSVSTIKLLPLTRRDSQDFIEEFSLGKKLAAEDTTRIVSRCDGVPLYLEEITRAALDNVDVSILERDTTDIPEALRDLLMARLDRLGTGTELVQIASVLGRRFSLPQVQAVAEQSAEEVVAGLAALERAGVLMQHDVAGEPGYQFNHALTADAAYASLLGESKRQLHARIARLLDADPISAEREPETAARHYEWAGELVPAIRLRELAGHRARERSASVEAAHHFSKAVKLANRLPVDDNQCRLELRLRLDLGTQLIACYGNGAPEVEANFERARELCDLVPDEHMHWQTLYGLWSFYQVTGRLREARNLGEKLLEHASRLESSGVSILAHRAHGLCLFAMGEFDQSRTHLERAIELYNPELHSVRNTGDISDIQVLAKCNLGWLCCFQGERERAVELHNDAIALAEKLNHQHSLAFALALAAASHQALDDRKKTHSLARRLVQHSESQGYPYWLAWGLMLSAWSQTGNDTSSSEAFDAGFEAYENTGGRMMNAYFMTLRAEFDIAERLFADALSRLSDAEQVMNETATRFYAAEIPRLQALVFSQLGDHEQVRQSLERATELARNQSNALLLTRIQKTTIQLIPAQNRTL